MEIKKYLNQYNENIFFQRSFKVGEVCLYNFNQFLFQDVQKLALRNNIVIEYIPGRTYKKLYGKYIDSAFRIINLVNEDPKRGEKLLFDINELN